MNVNLSPKTRASSPGIQPFFLERLNIAKSEIISCSLAQPLFSAKIFWILASVALALFSPIRICDFGDAEFFTPAL
jgi:hypothetical protein